MSTEIRDHEFLMRCNCGDRMEHVAWLIHDVDPKHGDDWFLMTSLDRRFGFWRRLWTGLRYAFRPRSLRYYGYSELVLTDADVDGLAEFIRRRRTAYS